MPGESQQKKQKLKPLESIGVGVATGFVSATVYMPFMTLKVRYQCGEPFTLDPRILYKGYPTILGVIVPVTAIQIFNASRVENAVSGTTVSSNQRMLSSFLGGASSALISNTLNLSVTQLHKHKYASPFLSLKTLMANHGTQKIMVGLPTSAMGEGLFTLAYYGIVPLVKPHVKKHVDNELASTLMTGVIAGVPTAVITQPLDRIKTWQHKHADVRDAQGNKHGLTRCVKELYQTEGFRVGFFKGLIPRGLGLTATITAAGAAAEFAQNSFRKR
ncbi:MAG: MC/SLC25 family protein [Legionella sp.]|nr:MC/SLC25 family protein [Legionella sp.]